MLSERLAVLLVCAMCIDDRLLYDQGWLAKGEWLMLAGLEVGGCCTKADSCERADGTPAVQRSREPWPHSSLLQPSHGGATPYKARPSKPWAVAAVHVGRPGLADTVPPKASGLRKPSGGSRNPTDKCSLASHDG